MSIDYATLDALCALIADDACQRAEVEPLDRGYRDDPEAMAALRMIAVEVWGDESGERLAP